MRVEAGGLPELGNGRSAVREAGARRRGRRTRAPPAMAALAAVQRLFEACREVFYGARGAVPPPAGVERIKSVLDSITAADVGLTPNMSYFRRVESRGTPRITYLHLYECEVFSIGIFCLPSRGVIPLRSHPDVQLQGHRLAKVKADGILSAPCETSVLYSEDGGNKHWFTAQSACAVLDVLGPPYDDGSGRHCQHYNVSSSAPSVGDSGSLSGCDGYAWLEDIEPPEDFYLVGSTYMGPKILDH